MSDPWGGLPGSKRSPTIVGLLIRAWTLLMVPWLSGCHTTATNEQTTAKRTKGEPASKEERARKDNMRAEAAGEDQARIKRDQQELSEVKHAIDVEWAKLEQARKLVGVEEARAEAATKERSKADRETRAAQARVEHERKVLIEIETRAARVKKQLADATQAKEKLDKEARDRAARAAGAEINHAQRREFLLHVISELSEHGMEVKCIEEVLASNLIMGFVAKEKKLTIAAPPSFYEDRQANRGLFKELIKTIAGLEENGAEVHEFTFTPLRPQVVRFCLGKLTIGPTDSDSPDEVSIDAKILHPTPADNSETKQDANKERRGP